jgi:5-formyltetrahydrofolate cyclo-ligase
VVSAGSERQDPPELAAAKQVMRREMGERRRRIQADESARAGAGIADFLRETAHFRAAACIGAFASIAGEPDTRPLVELALEEGKRVAMPRCDPSGALGFHTIGDVSELRRGAFGLLEPPETLPMVSPRALELVLVPGVAFDLSGGRLGRGAAYYDRTFTHAVSGQLLVGVAYEIQIVERVPLGPGDRRVDALVTERGFRATNSPDHEV